MKTSLIIAALAVALITGSTASSQAIPAAPLGKSIQHNSSSLVESVLIRRGYRGYGAYRGYRHVGIYRGYRHVGLYRGYRQSAFTAVSACRLLWIPRIPRLPLGWGCLIS